jgi:hypothetical protein
MKKNLLPISVLFFLFSSLLFSQIPNAGFENWTGGEPNGWTSNNISFPLLVTTVSQSNQAHSGSSAVKLSPSSVFGAFYFAQIFNGTPENYGSPVSQRYGSLNGWYKFTQTLSSQAIVIYCFMLNNGTDIGGGAIEIFQASSSYQQFSCPITYFDSQIPDTIDITIEVIDTAGTIASGAAAYFDDLSLSGSVDVKEVANTKTPTSYEIMQNYPNPFNPSTKIEYTIPEESYVELKVYNLIGEEIATLVSQYQKTGVYRADFNAVGMQSGIYIARLNAGGFTRSMKMTLLK